MGFKCLFHVPPRKAYGIDDLDRRPKPQNADLERALARALLKAFEPCASKFQDMASIPFGYMDPLGKLASNSLNQNRSLLDSNAPSHSMHAVHWLSVEELTSEGFPILVPS